MPMNDSRPIVCVDLNGVLDRYTGWRHEKHWDPPRPGADRITGHLTRHLLCCDGSTARSIGGEAEWIGGTAPESGECSGTTGRGPPNEGEGSPQRGRGVSPTGRGVSPTGERGLPNGERGLPNGGEGSPQRGEGSPQRGRGVSPTGRGVSPTREGGLPNGERGLPNGERGLPNEGEGSPQRGRGVSPTGRGVSPTRERGLPNEGEGSPQRGEGSPQRGRGASPTRESQPGTDEEAVAQAGERWDQAVQLAGQRQLLPSMAAETGELEQPPPAAGLKPELATFAVEVRGRPEHWVRDEPLSPAAGAQVLQRPLGVAGQVRHPGRSRQGRLGGGEVGLLVEPVKGVPLGRGDLDRDGKFAGEEIVERADDWQDVAGGIACESAWKVMPRQACVEAERRRRLGDAPRGVSTLGGGI